MYIYVCIFDTCIVRGRYAVCFHIGATSNTGASA